MILSMLDQILEATRNRVKALRPRASELTAAAAIVGPARDFGAALSMPHLSVIAEIKRRSPSRGDLAPGLDPVHQATSYEGGGASAISVLTEPDFFGGTSADLEAVKRSVGVPVLRKDFILDDLQVVESKAMGADALLLIVAAMDVQRLRHLLELTRATGLEALVEAHDASEVELALAAGATIIGVNNRNLTTFEVDLATAEDLAEMLASADITVGESGIHSAQDARRMARAGYNAVLVGESLVRSSDPAALIRELRDA
jgi:indole-3-glycerol phosphate synthase